MKRKLVIGAAVVALGALLAVGGTLAWFTDIETVTNVVTMGKVDISLTEKAPDVPAGVDWSVVPDGTGYKYMGITPGAELPKAPVVTVDEESNDAYVRTIVMVTGLDSGQAAKLVYLKNGKQLQESIDYELTDNEPVFYCGTVLKGGETFIPFDTVKFPGADFGNELAGANINIEVKAEAIQADNLGVDNAKDAFVGQTMRPLEEGGNS